jgi:lipopolysaccharide transport protein LptA
VRVLHTEANISSRTLTVQFDATNRVQQIRAEEQVRIESGASEAFGDVAEYDMQNEKIVLSGSPHWKVDQTKGRSDVLIFYPKTKEIMALHGVEMTFPGQSVGSVFGVNVRTNQAASISSTDEPVVIRSETFSRGTNVAVFHQNVRITDARGGMSSELITVVTGSSNQVQRIIAENRVRIEQEGFVATGSRADYNVATGLVHLTGEPELVSDDKSLKAESFIIDRSKNTFSVSPGKYRIQMQMKSKEPRP